MKTEISKRKVEERDLMELEDKGLRKGPELTNYFLSRALRRIAKATSRRRRLPYGEADDTKSYHEYNQSILKFVEEKRALIENLYSGVYEKVLMAVKSFRKLLSNSNSRINEIIELGLLPKFVESLKSPERMLQYEASWLISNITFCSSVQLRFVIESGAVESLAALLWTDCETVSTQAAWALGNIAGDADEYRDHVISKGALPGLLHLIKSLESEENLLTCNWVLENLCFQSKDTSKLIPVLPVLRDLLSHNSSVVVYDCLKVLTSLTVHEELIKEAIYCGLLPDLLEVMKKGDDYATYVLEVIGNLMNSDDNFIVQNLIQYKIFQHLSVLMLLPDLYIRRQVSLIINNITYNKKYISPATRSGIFSLLLKSLSREDDERIQKLIVDAVSNVLSLGTIEEVHYFLGCELLKVLCNVLAGLHESVLLGALSCLEALLDLCEADAKASDRPNQIAVEVEQLGGLATLQLLLSHQSEEVYLKAFHLMERYFCAEEEKIERTLEEMYEEYVCA